MTRRVDTYTFLDTEAVRQSATFDIDNRKLNEIKKEAFNKSPHKGRELRYIPLMLMHKELFLDVSLATPGKVNHLCRRSENIAISAHIIVGKCLSMGCYPDQAESLFSLAIRYLGHDRSAKEGEKREAETNLIVEVRQSLPDNYEEKKLLDLLEQLTNHYIQCVEYDFSEEEAHTSIIKINFVSKRSPVTKKDSEIRRHLLREDALTFTKLCLSGAPNKLKEGDLEFEGAGVLNGRVATFLRRLNWDTLKRSGLKILRSSGLRATYIRIPLLGNDLPNHVRIVAAEGSVIDEVSGRGTPNATPSYQQEKEIEVISRRHRERASLLLRGGDVSRYHISAKINPKRSDFIIPAIVIAILQITMMGIAMFVGPAVVSRNSVAFTGTTLITPFVTALFLTRGSEHELIAKVLFVPRIMLLLSSISTIVTGAFLSVLADPVDSGIDGGNSAKVIEGEIFHVEPIAFSLLCVSLFLSYACLVMFWIILRRIGLMRKVSNEYDMGLRMVVKGVNGMEDVERRRKRDVNWALCRLGFWLLVAAILAFAIPYAIYHIPYCYWMQSCPAG